MKPTMARFASAPRFEFGATARSVRSRRGRAEPAGQQVADECGSRGAARDRASFAPAPLRLKRSGHGRAGADVCTRPIPARGTLSSSAHRAHGRLRGSEGAEPCSRRRRGNEAGDPNRVRTRSSGRRGHQRPPIAFAARTTSPADKVFERQREIVVARQHPDADLTVVLVDHQPVSVDHVHFGMRDEIASDISQRAWEKQIVGIEPGHDFAGRVAEATVDCVGLAVVHLGDPAGQKTVEALQHVERLIGRSPVLHDVFEGWILLADDAIDRPIQKSALLIRGGDNRDRRCPLRRARPEVPRGDPQRLRLVVPEPADSRFGPRSEPGKILRSELRFIAFPSGLGSLHAADEGRSRESSPAQAR